jgi:acyl-coenzyme A thioesterase PaaI-like protein
MTLLDVVMAHAARTPGADGVAETSGVVTIEMKTTFLRPGTRPPRRHRPPPAPHRVDGVLRRLLVDAGGELIAHATAPSST